MTKIDVVRMSKGMLDNKILCVNPLYLQDTETIKIYIDEIYPKVIEWLRIFT